MTPATSYTPRVAEISLNLLGFGASANYAKRWRVALAILTSDCSGNDDETNKLDRGVWFVPGFPQRHFAGHSREGNEGLEEWRGERAGGCEPGILQRNGDGRDQGEADRDERS